MANLTAEKIRVYLADHPTVDVTLPLKAGVTVYAGGYCELSGGCVDVLATTGTFAGIALETKTGPSGTDGQETCRVRIMGALEVGIADTIAITSVASANSIEAEDSDTLRLETGTSITGTTVGKLMRVVTAGASGSNKAVVAFKATALLP
jgi:hypothetical protein